MHKAQVTVFVVIGLIVLIIAASAIIVLRKPSAPDNPELATVTNYVDSCVESTLEDAVEYVAYKGGYYRPPANYLEIQYSVIPYYFREGLLVPDIGTLEESLENYMDDQLASCLTELPGYEFETGQPTSKVSVTPGTVSARIVFPLTVRHGGAVSQLKDFSVSIGSGLYSLYTEAAQVAEGMQDTGRVCISCLNDASLYNTDLKTMVILLKDGRLIYRIAVQGETAPSRWSIEPIDTLEAYAGYPFTFQAKINGSAQVTWSSSLLNITSDGLISFTPQEQGSRLAIVTARDRSGLEKSELFTINVTGMAGAPSIIYIGYHTAFVGEEFELQVEAEGADTFIDDTALFDIGLYSGLIRFTPSQPGEHEINITAVNMEGAYSTEKLYLVVIQ